MKKIMLAILLVINFCIGFAQDAVGYQMPPKEIAELLLAKPTPLISITKNADWILLSERNSYPTVEELGQPEIRVAGLRLNPNNFGPSRATYINNFTLKNIQENKSYSIKGLPENMLAANVSWSPDETKIAFTHTKSTGIDLYTIDVATKTAKKINKQPLNIVLGSAFTWVNNNSLLYKTIVQPATAAPKKPITPKGPTVQQNIGKSAPSRTYQDLIKSPYDEQLFEFMSTAQLVINKGGIEQKISKPAIYNTISLSPDKQYMLLETIDKPFSYLVPANGFPSTIHITDMSGKVLKELAKLPSSETSPSGFDNVQNIPRSFDWRDDVAATITWCMPLDSGIMKNKVEYHDAVYALSAPFKDEPKELFKTKWRYRGTVWGNENFAWVNEALQSKQLGRAHHFNPSTGSLEKLFERTLTDAYSNPGSPVTDKNQFGRNVISVVNNKILLNNQTGSSPNGDLPFLAEFDLSKKESNILWRCPQGSFEYVNAVIDAKNMILLTRKESQKEVPNYYIKNLKLKIADRPVTNFTNPYPQLEGISKQKIKYKRADGIDLTGDLYLPKGYNKENDGPLPVFMWAYPREFTSAADAAQVRGSADKFTLLNWGTPIYWATQGYAVLDNAEMPIVAAGDDKKPNDTFIEQLQLNAEAAINKLTELGVGDKNRIAVGGHSYGAFMTANLLAHTKLFKAGIARSGAYNRTLTPFGFQGEDRTYWQAPELYTRMSPFTYADKIKTPLLLIHGDSDDNPGTFPINSERLFSAVKGHGGTVRFVFLPYEGHSYRGKENLLHMLWEQHQWLEKYVKSAK